MESTFLSSSALGSVLEAFIQTHFASQLFCQTDLQPSLLLLSEYQCAILHSVDFKWSSNYQVDFLWLFYEYFFVLVQLPNSTDIWLHTIVPIFLGMQGLWRWVASSQTNYLCMRTDFDMKVLIINDSSPFLDAHYKLYNPATIEIILIKDKHHFK